MRRGIIVLLSAIAIGCGNGASYSSMTRGMGIPQIALLSPSQVAAGSPAFNLIISGTGFTPGTIVYWGMTPLPMATTYNSATQVTALIAASMVAHSAAVSVWLHTSGGNSNLMTFTVM
jgi:hypothetical protein